MNGIYQVSNLGRIRNNSNFNYRGRILKPFWDTHEYLQVRLYKDNKNKSRKVHRIVAETFIPNPNNLPQVNHIDENPKNNRVDNLEWCSNIENQLHAWKLGLQTPYWKGKFGKDHITSKKVKQYDKNKNLIKIWDSVSEASKTLNINDASISRCCLHHKYRHTAGGFIWEYL